MVLTTDIDCIHPSVHIHAERHPIPITFCAGSARDANLLGQWSAQQWFHPTRTTDTPSQSHAANAVQNIVLGMLQMFDTPPRFKAGV